MEDTSIMTLGSDESESATKAGKPKRKKYVRKTPVDTLQKAKQPLRPTQRDGTIPPAATELAKPSKYPSREERRQRRANRKPGSKIGAPTTYRAELGDEICNRIASGYALTTVLQGKDKTEGKEETTIFELFPHLKGKLSFTAVQQWLETHASFATVYARAYQHRADRLADEIVAISDEVKAKSNAEVQKAKLRVESRKWTASKLRPDRYGERLDINQNINLKQLDDSALDDRISRLLGLQGKVISGQQPDQEED